MNEKELTKAVESWQEFVKSAKKIHIVGGGTSFYLCPHLAISAPAKGGTARRLNTIFNDLISLGKNKLMTVLHLTKMCEENFLIEALETNEDIEKLIDKIVADPATKIVILTAALCDYEPYVNYIVQENTKAESFEDFAKHKTSEILIGKDVPRFRTNIDKKINITLSPAKKIVGKIRQHRKDIFAVAFKQTHGATPEEQYIDGLNLLKKNSLNLVLANDTKTMLNMVITPEEASYHVTTDRYEALRGLAEIALLRSHLTFTQSTVVAGDPIPWNSELVPEALRTVVNYCVERGAYKPFNGATVGHFACKLTDTTFLTSIRKSNFNDIEKNGLVKIETDGPDTVLAYGAKPSVGGQSQRIVFKDHEGYDCICHFHCEKTKESKVPVVSQREIECGSKECGQNTSNGLQQFGNLKAVYLDNHGPNILFNHDINPQEVIDFIEENFDLSTKTGGYII